MPLRQARRVGSVVSGRSTDDALDGRTKASPFSYEYVCTSTSVRLYDYRSTTRVRTLRSSARCVEISAFLLHLKQVHGRFVRSYTTQPRDALRQPQWSPPRCTFSAMSRTALHDRFI